MIFDGFGLRENPFAISPDPRFIYFDNARRDLISKLISSVRDVGAFILIAGEPGVGKTILLRHLGTELETTHDILVVISSGLDPSLNELLDSGIKDQKVVFLISNAEDLPSSVLRRLVRLASSEERNSRRPSVVFDGKPKIALINDPRDPESIEQAFNLIVRLAPFQKDDVGPYIRHRLRAAGYGGPDLFTPAAIDRIAEQSDGSPRAINRICRSALAIAARRGDNVVSVGTVAEVDPGWQTDKPSSRISASKANSQALLNRSKPDSSPHFAESLAHLPTQTPLVQRTLGAAADSEEQSAESGTTKRFVLRQASLNAVSVKPSGLSPNLDVARSKLLDSERSYGTSKPKRVVSIAVTFAIGAIAGAAVLYQARTKQTGETVTTELDTRVGKNDRLSEGIPGVSSLLGRKSDSPKTEPLKDRSRIPEDLPQSTDRAPAPPVASASAKGSSGAKLRQDLSAEPDVTAPQPNTDSGSAQIEINTLLARGDQFMGLKDIASARLFYRRAATKGSARAAVLLAQTYDPVELQKIGTTGVSATAAEAVTWYQKAISMGDPYAKEHLDTLIGYLKTTASQGDAEAKRIIEQTP